MFLLKSFVITVYNFLLRKNQIFSIAAYKEKITLSIDMTILITFIFMTICTKVLKFSNNVKVGIYDISANVSILKTRNFNCIKWGFDL